MQSEAIKLNNTCKVTLQYWIDVYDKTISDFVSLEKTTELDVSLILGLSKQLQEELLEDIMPVIDEDRYVTTNFGINVLSADLNNKIDLEDCYQQLEKEYAQTDINEAMYSPKLKNVYAYLYNNLQTILTKKDTSTSNDIM